MWPFSKLFPKRSQSSSPRVAVVTPWKPGVAWCFRESWLQALNDLGASHVEFHVTKDKRRVRQLFRDLNRTGADVVLLSGGDHHMSFLHDTEAKQDFWKSLKSTVLCLCMERVVNSPWPASEEKTGSAIRAFDAFYYFDEFAEPLFRESGKPSRWIPQFADDAVFHPRHAFEDRLNRLYFRATLTNFGIEGVYSARRALVDAVRNHPCFDLHEASKNSWLSPVEYAETLSKHRFVFRTPSNCPGWVENFWTAMASGCVVFHQALPADEVKSRPLLVPGKHYVEYDMSNPQALLKQAEDALKNWGDYRHIGENAVAVFRERFTVRHVIADMLRFVDEAKLKKCGAASAA